MKVCAEKGCPVLVEGGRCERHRKDRANRRDARRGSRQERGYGGRWPRISKRFLQRFPLCGMRADGLVYSVHSRCAKEGRPRLAECTDHILSKAQGGTDDEANLQSLCLACNSRKANEFEGGFGKSL